MRVGALLAVLAVGQAWAGPPYLSDDPQPTDLHRWEVYGFVAGARGPSGLGGDAGLDINYGGAPDLQLTAVLPIAFDNAAGLRFSGLRTGFGDVELAAKYRFLHQREGSWTPDVSVFPRLFAPTGGRRFGSGRLSLLLPVWAQKDWGPWSLFGGGGWQLNPGAGNRNFWQGGAALARTVTPKLQLGLEVFAQGDDTRAAPGEDGGGYVALNFGAIRKVTSHWSLLASAGPSWERAGRTGAVGYLSLKADY